MLSSVGMKTLAARTALLLLIAAWPASDVQSAPAQRDRAQAEGLRRCVGADGGTIFTDRRCEDLHAVASIPPGSTGRPAAVVSVRSCARNQNDLLFGVRAALENGDANRLADFYHWTGMGNAQGYRVMGRLSAFSKRPVVDVQLVSTWDPNGYASDDFEFSRTPAEDIGSSPENFDDSFEFSASLEESDAENTSPPARRPRAADLLRVDQMRGEADLASETTYFHLLNNAGCWWMQF